MLFLGSHVQRHAESPELQSLQEVSLDSKAAGSPIKPLEQTAKKRTRQPVTDPPGT